MRRTRSLTLIAACLVLMGTGCSGSDGDPGQIQRIDGPAQVDDDVRVEPAGGDVSTEG
jgi:hypothetical protein